MKKLLAVFLALMMILSVSLMACQKDDLPTNDDVEDDDFVANKNNTDTTDTTDDKKDDDDAEDTSNGGNTSWINEPVTVYVRANGVNVRASAGKNGSIIGSANMGDSFASESHNDSWYKITYNGAVAYISASCVTANQNIVTFVDPTAVAANSVITIKTGEKCNLRSDPAGEVESTLKGSIDSTKTANGELKIVKINKTNTWIEVRFTGTDLEGHTYNGTEVLYCTASVIVELTNNSSSGNGHG